MNLLWPLESANQMDGLIIHATQSYKALQEFGWMTDTCFIRLAAQKAWFVCLSRKLVVLAQLILLAWGGGEIDSLICSENKLMLNHHERYI